MRPCVYLAGPIRSTSGYSQATSWRHEASCALHEAGITAYSPLRGKEAMKEIDWAAYKEGDGASRSTPLSTPSGIVTRDHFDVKRCDMMLANLLRDDGGDAASLGTCIEFGWALAYDKPVVMVIDLGVSNPHEHAMLLEIAGYVVETLEEGLAICKAILNPY